MIESTNENLKGICSSNFELAHYAIELGRYFIHSGKEAHLSDIIREIKRHRSPRYLEELKELERIDMQRRRDGDEG